jgi:D-sedoheptulose 7-phosphate isomerase
MIEDQLQEVVQEILGEVACVSAAIKGMLQELSCAVDIIAERIDEGGCLILLGNGGSAAQAQHLAAEFVGRFQSDRRPLPAIALTTDTSALTAIGNDYGFEEIFARQLRALGRPGDVALAISTSGDSTNVLRALDVARERNIRAIGLTGRNGGQVRERVDLCLCAPSDSTPRIQEAHLVICHILCRLIESSVLPGESRD